VRILGIESSCDETAAAVVEEEAGVLSSVVASQLDEHAKYGGVVPELASREHLRAVVPVVRLAMEQAHTTWDQLDAIAVTVGPGLIGSLLVGLTYAKALSFARNIPLIAINHIEGHIHAVVLESRLAGNPVEFPALALIVSGGHTHLFDVSPEFRYKLLGRTRDDAAGEAFDKVGKLLGYSYPGGPLLDKLAAHGDPRAVRFTIAKMKSSALDFSFSGLKTAVLRWVEAHHLTAEIEARRHLFRANPHPTFDEWLALTPQATRDLIASFQYTVVKELVQHATASSGQMKAKSVIISGGVACNSGLRRAAHLSVPVHFPTPALSTDNAVMIAAAAFPKFHRREFASLDEPPHAHLPLSA
jgi:N6-L-threonylcarbamoyladenine synthase